MIFNHLVKCYAKTNSRKLKRKNISTPADARTTLQLLRVLKNDRQASEISANTNLPGSLSRLASFGLVSGSSSHTLLQRIFVNFPSFCLP
jgi:hypothetical protein